VKTLLASTYRNMEIIVVNDGSTDHTATSMHRFLTRNARDQAIFFPDLADGFGHANPLPDDETILSRSRVCSSNLLVISRPDGKANKGVMDIWVEENSVGRKDEKTFIFHSITHVPDHQM
jgi:glycosyltransferase involved in cell wall biosynthesis